MKHLLFPLGAALALGLMVSGCATAKPEAMVPAEFKIERKHAASVTVANPAEEGAVAKWASMIRSTTFREAVSQSIQKSGLFATVLKTPDANYLLEVTKVQSDEPAFGFNMTVDLVTRWVLKKSGSNEVVFQGNVSSTYTAKMGEAFAGAKRLRLANEGAAKANIKEGLRRLSQLKL
jgi:hypothetical protein